MMCWILLGSRGRTATRALLVAGSAAYLAADLSLHGPHRPGHDRRSLPGWLDTLWLVAYGLYLLAVLHPSARRVTRARSNEQRTISRSRLALSGLTLIAPIIALGISGADARHLAVALTVEGVLVVLVLLRLADLASGERRARQALSDRELLFRSLVQNASEAVVVLDPGRGRVVRLSCGARACSVSRRGDLHDSPFFDGGARPGSCCGGAVALPGGGEPRSRRRR